ncbi:HYC_CC_PP family protein [Flavobacterium sp.]|uniref:HYC_CC_PP family protein n=1 Tax=Flavobacterium sp. TaxID=239 RepID=UPI0039E57D0A
MKLKKCTSLLLALLVLFSNAGLAFNVHYCGGEIAKISSVYASDNASADGNPMAERACCIAKAKENKTCCDNKIIQSEKKSDVVVKTFSFQIDAPFVLHQWNPLVFVPVAEVTIPQTTSYYCDAHAPPLYQLYSQLIFYA